MLERFSEGADRISLRIVPEEDPRDVMVQSLSGQMTAFRELQNQLRPSARSIKARP